MNYNEIPDLVTMDAEELISMPLPKVQFTVESLISQGLFLLVGDSKIGKSWLTLWMCQHVASGESVWNFPVRKGVVLYLCLEDNKQRMQNRLFELGIECNRSLHFGWESADLSQGLIVQMERHMEEHPDTVLIAVDTLQKIRGNTSDNCGAYANDYREMGILKTFADKYHISILLVHHTSKRPAERDDPFKRISGTTGIMGAADGCLVLSRKNAFEKTATLSITGRDVEERQMTISREDGFVWKLLEYKTGKELQTLHIPPVILAVIRFMGSVSKWSGTATELSSLLGLPEEDQLSPQSLTIQINRFHTYLEENGIIYRTKRSATQRTITLYTRPPQEQKTEDTDSMTSHGQAS